MKIGIFWVVNNTVIGKACSIEDGEESVPGLIDTNYSHHESWELDQNFILPFPELVGMSYQRFPRGRVIYSRYNNEAWVYLDKSLKTPTAKQLLIDYFILSDTKVKWISDPHYVVFDDSYLEDF